MIWMMELCGFKADFVRSMKRVYNLDYQRAEETANNEMKKTNFKVHWAAHEGRDNARGSLD